MTVSETYTTAPTQGPEKVLESFALLNQLHIPYSRVEHEPAETMEACAAISDALGIRICKNLFLCNRQKTDFYLLTMPEDKPFHTKDLSAQIGSARLSFAPEEKLWELLHCTPGSATILGLANDTDHQVRLLMERNNIRRAVYVGDTEGDEKASRFAGIPFLWASYGFGTAAAPDAVINAITDLPDVVSKMDW